MKVPETVCDSAVMLSATTRMNQITGLLLIETDEKAIAALRAEYASLDGSWITVRIVELPDAITVEQGAVLMQAEQQKEANGRTMEQQADQALANLRAYRDLASPSNAQTIAVIKVLCRVAIGLIRLRLSKLDATD